MTKANVVSEITYDHKTFADVDPGDIVIVPHTTVTLLGRPIVGNFNLLAVHKVWRGADSTSIRYTVLTGRDRGMQSSVYTKTDSPLLIGEVASSLTPSGLSKV